MVSLPKPAPDLFLHAAQEMGSDPTHCLVIEDSAAGVSAAVAAGMRVVGYAVEPRQGERLKAHGAMRILDDLTHLLDL